MISLIRMNSQPYFDIYFKHCFLDQLLGFSSYFIRDFFVSTAYMTTSVLKIFRDANQRFNYIIMFRKNAVKSVLNNNAFAKNSL